MSLSSKTTPLFKLPLLLQKQNHKDIQTLKKNTQITPWGIHAIGADLTNGKKADGGGIKIALLDTGIANHGDLKVKGGVSFVESVDSYSDDNGHGTHVAGTIAAMDNTFGVVGVASKVDLYAVKVLDSAGTGDYAQVIQGIDWAVKRRSILSP